MEQYISKAAVVAEIKRLIELFTIPQYSCEYNDAKADGFREFLSFINTLEVKEISFEYTKSVFEGQYLSKDKVVTTIERLQDECEEQGNNNGVELLEKLFNKLNTLEIKDPYEQYVQHDSIKSGIQAHADTYSFNIESKLFNQLTKEQQKLWRKEIEQACISGGEVGVELARDPRYKENVELKEVDLEKHLKEDIEDVLFDLDGVAVKGATHYLTVEDVKDIAKHFFKLGIQAQKGE